MIRVVIFSRTRRSRSAEPRESEPQAAARHAGKIATRASSNPPMLGRRPTRELDWPASRGKLNHNL